MNLTIPVTWATSERTFSALRRLKNYLRSRQLFRQSCFMVLMHCHKSITDTTDTVKIAKRFACAMSNPKGLTQQDRNTHVTTALGFFSTAYTLTFRPDSSPAVSEARTSGPRPAPTTIITLTRKRLSVNPLCVNSDQHQFSPNYIHTLSRDKVMRINKMITKEKMS